MTLLLLTFRFLWQVAMLFIMEPCFSLTIFIKVIIIKVFCTSSVSCWVVGRSLKSFDICMLYSIFSNPVILMMCILAHQSTKVLKVRYCDQTVSVVCSSCVVNIDVVNTLEATDYASIFMRLYKNVDVIISQSYSNMGHIRSYIIPKTH